MRNNKNLVCQMKTIFTLWRNKAGAGAARTLVPGDRHRTVKLAHTPEILLGVLFASLGGEVALARNSLVVWPLVIILN
jgi:hypothetical protein